MENNLTSGLKLAAGMIVFNGDYVLRECLENIYPFVEQILITEGPVQYFVDQGFTTSTDKTNEILNDFPDPENKITIIHGQWSEKDEMCNAYIKHLRNDIDYIINLDSDEFWKHEDLIKLCTLLKEKQYTSVGVRSVSFFGGFDHYISGFEQQKDNFLRVFKVVPGCSWKTHRPPTIKYPQGIQQKHIDSDTLYEQTGIQMYHYSYVFPDQVYSKIQYYKAKVSGNNCIDDYFYKVWLPWVQDEEMRPVIEQLYNGVHEFKNRPAAFTKPFDGEHPKVIQENLDALRKKCEIQLEQFI